MVGCVLTEETLTAVLHTKQGARFYSDQRKKKGLCSLHASPLAAQHSRCVFVMRVRVCARAQFLCSSL